MNFETQSGEDPTAAEARKAWQPSRAPDYRADHARLAQSRIIERPHRLGPVAMVARFLRRPFVKIILGLGLFILAAIVYDATVNFRSWTERQERPKATEHKGTPKVPAEPKG